MNSPELVLDKDLDAPPQSTVRALLDFAVELVKVVAICAAIIIVVRWFLFQPFYVKGSSMEPSFSDSEYLIIYQLPYRFPDTFGTFSSSEDRGRSIIFHPPNDPKQFYIKRLIGLPGERVQIEDGVVWVYNTDNPEGFVLEEPYLSPDERTLAGIHADVELSTGEVYVLGDNRNASLDSRRIGPIPIENIVGEPIIRGWPVDKIGILQKPEY